jgi:hypothetical protein
MNRPLSHLPRPLHILLPYTLLITLILSTHPSPPKTHYLSQILVHRDQKIETHLKKILNAGKIYQQNLQKTATLLNDKTKFIKATLQALSHSQTTLAKKIKSNYSTLKFFTDNMKQSS